LKRSNFAQVLKEAKVDITREYYRLYAMFNNKNSEMNISFRDICEQNFDRLPFKGTCITLRDFDDYYGFNFEKEPKKVDINYLINFCEYVYNLAIYNNAGIPYMSPYGMGDGSNSIIMHIHKVIELIGYMEAKQDGLTIFVPKSQPAIVVSEMLPSDLSYKVIEYNHHTMKGDLKRKQITLKLLADLLEGKRAALHKANGKLESNIFSLVNNLNIRHNNIDPSSDKYKKVIAEMSEEELEQWYDEIYEMILLAFMELDHEERKEKITELQEKFSPKK